MVYETSHESGRQPYVPDKNRGKWANPSDFIYVCMSGAFKLDLTLMFWFLTQSSGVSALLLYLLCLAIYVVPVLIIQLFVGQFSSSGYLSAFRISPLFKGIGYVSLFINFLVLTSYSIFAAVPLLFFLNSFRPTLPWSCEGFKEWGGNITSICNVTAATEINYINESDNKGVHVPSVLYFISHVPTLEMLMSEDSEHFVSWSILFCNFVPWVIVGATLLMFFNPEKIGNIIRYSVWTVLALMALCLLRFMFLSGVVDGLAMSFKDQSIDDLGIGVSAFVGASAAFGAGWGSVITLASFNQFRSNIVQQSWIIGLSQMFIYFAFSLLITMVECHIYDKTSDSYLMFVESHWVSYMSSGSVIAGMELANMWTFLFFGMQVLAALIVLVSQTFSFLVTIFDEFESLRIHKKEVILGTISLMAFFALFYSSNRGITYFTSITTDTLITQISLNLLLLLVVLWIYGRERFQRDFEFMLRQPFATWKIIMLRFVSPIYLCFFLLFFVFFTFYNHSSNGTVVIDICAVVFVVLPWLFIPGYGIYSIRQLIGPWKSRFWRCCRPTDWYPVETEDRQSYVAAVGANEMHQVLEEVS